MMKSLRCSAWGWWMKLLSRLSPHQRLTENPLFNLEVRRIHWGSSERALWRYSVRRLEIVVGVLLILWLGTVHRNPQALDFDGFPALLVALGLLAGVLLDFASMAAVLSHGIGADSERWDLLRLTRLTIAQIVAARHGVAQVRVWRFTIYVIALRAAAALIVLLTYAQRTLVEGAQAGYRADWWFSALLGILVVGGVGVLYVIEPLWRARMVTALGLALAMRVRNRASALPLALAGLGGLWLASVFLAILIFIGVSLAFSQVFLLGIFFLQAVICTPLVIAALHVTIYGFYSVVQVGSLRRAEYWLDHTQVN
jgi:hypothetical protein